jgi:hypothetical protein
MSKINGKFRVEVVAGVVCVGMGMGIKIESCWLGLEAGIFWLNFV